MHMADKLPINLGHHRYDILVGERLLAKAGSHIKPLLKRPHVIIVSDERVAKFYLHRLVNSLEEAGIQHRSVIVPEGEGTKSLAGFSKVIEQILEQKPSRETTLIALGGGMVGDLTGFAASVLLRGVNFVQIPTTLLAQVDSSVGGKTGINSAYGKNLIGSFHQPVLVLSDVATLSTLPKRELLAGYAEMLKYALINDAGFFAWLETNARAMLAGDVALLTHAILHCCKAKAAIVEADEKEHNVRALLNLGHTFGHALEAETGYGDALLHGESVAIGMVMALSMSVAMGLAPADDLEKIQAHYEAVGLPSSPKTIRPEWNEQALMEHFTRDKKSKDGTLTFVLMRGIGGAFVEENVDPAVVRRTLREFLS
ncbi:MAG: 3-dehydroquinate synthase [Alphaproteobacteria bacterium]|nr:3-dehydroquinate synthase [Alphaproteobacteria bacterium]